MRRLMSISAAFVVVLSFVFSSIAFAQQARVIEETLILKDPTVAAAGKWVAGGALEYFYVRGPWKAFDKAGNVTETGTVSFSLPGANIFAGYGDFTVNYAYKNGSGNTNLSFTSDGVTHTDATRQRENEITIRWLIRDLAQKYFTPYVLAGYTQVNTNDTDTLTTPGFVWAYNLQTTSRSTTDFKGPLAGIGVIVPVNNTLGFRIDGRVMRTSATFTRDDGFQVSGSGTSGGLTGTMYVNIVEGLNLQLGGRLENLNGGAAGQRTRSGAFAMIGYSFK